MLKSLNDVRNLKDPLKQFVSTWTFGTVAGTSLPADLELRCQSYGFPTLTGDTTEVEWAGFKRVYAGKQTRQGSWTVTFIEVWDVKIFDGFKEWVNCYHAYKDGKIGLHDNYWTDVNIKLLDPSVYIANQPTKVTDKYDLKLYDVYPTEISIGEIDASSSNPITITATFNYNFFLAGDEIEAKNS